MNEDFRLFLVNLLLSLKQTATLDENLCTVMSSLLDDLQQRSGARVSAHVFANPQLNELHVMALGCGATTAAPLRAERHYRHRPGIHKDDPDHRRGLPSYKRLTVEAESDFMQMLHGSVEIGDAKLSEQMVGVLRQLYGLDKEEFAELAAAQEGDHVIVIPLRTGDYWRLGFFILWSPGNALPAAFADFLKQEELIGFREDVEKLLVRLFTNFYQMEADTYLPSYYQAERKRVALLCAEIRGFDRVSQLLRYDLGQERAADCLRKLVNRFSETAAQAIESYDDGRVDQIWGSGLLAVFGQYPNLADPRPNPSCMNAVMAAADIVEKARNICHEWLRDEFLLEGFMEMSSEHLELEPVVALDYGYAVFGYFGSEKKRVYMTVGDHVNFVRQLVSLAGQKEFEINDYEALLRRLKLMMNTSAPPTDQSSGAPILLSQSSFTGALPALRFDPRTPANWGHYRRTIQLAGKHTLYTVYEIWPENVIR